MENYDKAYEKALKLIKIRPHTAGEIERKLTLKGFNVSEAKEVSKTLQQQGLINDAQFAEVFLDNLIRYKSFGFYMLLGKLQQRGIPKADAEALLREKLPVEVETEIAARVVEKETDMDRNKLMQKLSRKGFRSDVIRNLIRD